MLQICYPAVLDQYEARFRERVDRWGGRNWAVCYRAEDRARKERWRVCQRKLEQQYNSYPLHTDYDPDMP